VDCGVLANVTVHQYIGFQINIVFQIMFLVRLEGVLLSKAYTPYVVEGGRPIMQSKNFIWKTIRYNPVSYEVKP